MVQSTIREASGGRAVPGIPPQGRSQVQPWFSRRGFPVVALLMVLLPACDSSSFTPPRPAELGGNPGGASALPDRGAAAPAGVTSSPGSPAARSRLVEMIFSEPPSADRLYLAQFLRRDTGTQRAAFRLTAPEPGKPFSDKELAAAIRTAAGRSTGVLIIEPTDGPEARQAILDAQSQGLPVILLDRPLASTSAGKSPPYVSLKGFAEAAEKMVATLTDDAKLFHVPAGADAVFLVGRVKDFYSSQRQEALTNALKARGIKFEVLEFDGAQKEALAVLAEYLKTHQTLGIIFVDDEFGVSAALQALGERKQDKHREVLIGGFAACDSRLDNYIRARTQALVNRNTEGFARKLLELSVALMDHKSVPDHVEVELPFVRNIPIYYPVSEGEQPKTKTQ